MITYSYDSFSNFYTKFKSSNKNLPYILDNYFSVGPHRAKFLCSNFGYPLTIRGVDLTESEWLRLKDFIESNFGSKSQILRTESRNIELLKKIRCYRGLRHSQYLPVRGQRTHTNAQTQKNKRIGRKKMSYRRK